MIVEWHDMAILLINYETRGEERLQLMMFTFTDPVTLPVFLKMPNHQKDQERVLRLDKDTNIEEIEEFFKDSEESSVSEDDQSFELLDGPTEAEKEMFQDDMKKFKADVRQEREKYQPSTRERSNTERPTPKTRRSWPGDPRRKLRAEKPFQTDSVQVGNSPLAQS